MRVSVCCCCINAKWEAQTFVEALYRHNADTHYEVVITHDDRVNDGSREFFDNLQRQYSNLKIVRHTEADTLEYLEKVLAYYDSKNIFDRETRRDIKDRFVKYKNGTLFDRDRSFLWLSSGVLYNKAVEASTGELVIVTPADFIYLFRLRDVSHWVKAHQQDGLFYGKPNAIWSRITNLPKPWVEEQMLDIQKKAVAGVDYRWDTNQFFVDYYRFPPKLSDFYLPDFKRNTLMPLDDPDFPLKCHDYSRFAFDHDEAQHAQHFHGFHFMTRKTFDAIGGFTEEFYGRAFADDKMSRHGHNYGCGAQTPPHISVAWIGPAALLESVGPGYPQGWQEHVKTFDPWYGKHPVVPDTPTFLHSINNADMNRKVHSSFSVLDKPIRLV